MVPRYDTAENLLSVLDTAIIKPAIAKEQELLARKTAEIHSRHVRDYL